MNVKKEIPQVLKKIGKRFSSLESRVMDHHSALLSRLARLEKERKTLLHQGVDFGNPVWKKQKKSPKADAQYSEYLRIYYSDGARLEMEQIGQPVEKRFTYVGKDNTKVKDKLEQIQRAERVREINREIRSIHQVIVLLRNEMSQIEQGVVNLTHDIERGGYVI